MLCGRNRPNVPTPLIALSLSRLLTNCSQLSVTNAGGYKDSGMGREKGEYALSNYMQIKAVYQPLEHSAWR
jgi:aldehyde dehydrogenase (NAD+)